MDDQKGTLKGMRSKLGSHQRLEADRAMAERLGVAGPAMVVVANGRATAAQNIKANEIQSGRRLLPAGRFRPLALPHTSDGVDRGRPCTGPSCPANPTPTPPPPRSVGASMRPSANVQQHLQTLTRQWTPNGRRADGSLIPSALTGDGQRQATAALLGMPASQVTDAMIQDLYARVTKPSGLVRQDAASRIPRRAAPVVQPAPKEPVTVPAPTKPGDIIAKRDALLALAEQSAKKSIFARVGDLIGAAVEKAKQAVATPAPVPGCTGDS